MRSRLDADLLEIFCAVREHGYLNRAADKLGMTTSAVSHALDRLEKSVNAELLDRNRRPVRLTEAGKELFRESRPLVTSFKTLGEKFSALSYQRPALRIGLGEVITGTISPWIIGELEKRIPQLKIVSGLNCVLTEKLKGNELDLCVYSDGLLNEARWKRQPLYEEKYLVVTGEALPIPRNIEDIVRLANEHPFVTYTQSSLDQAISYQFLRTMNIRPSTQIQVGTSYCLVGLINQTSGWSILPPTNLWCGGAFAKTVHWAPIPGNISAIRRQWVLGREEHAETIEWLAKITRNLFVGRTLAMLDTVSPKLRRYAYKLI